MKPLHAQLAEGNRLFDLIVKGDSRQLERCCDILERLWGRKEAAVEKFLLTCFNQFDKVIELKRAKNSLVTGADLISRVAELLSRRSDEALEVVLARRNVLPFYALVAVVSNAWRVWPREKVYREFAPLLRHKSDFMDKHEAVETAIFFTRPRVWPGLPVLECDLNPEAWKAWDPRWLDAAIKSDRRGLVCLLARPHHNGAINYLLKAVNLKDPDDAGQTIAALSLCQYRRVTDFYLYLIEKSIGKRKEGFKHQVYFLIEMAKHLPRADLPRLEAFAPLLPEKLIKHFHEAIAPLRKAQNRPKPV